MSINPLLYKQIMFDVEKLYLRFFDADSELVAMENSLMANAATQDAALQNEITNVRSIIANRKATVATQIVNLVAATQNLVLKTNPTIDSFLSANSLQIPQFVADISLQAGFTISQSNVKPCPSSSSSG